MSVGSTEREILSDQLKQFYATRLLDMSAEPQTLSAVSQRQPAILVTIIRLSGLTSSHGFGGFRQEEFGAAAS
jgi:hypothetical protein